MFGPTAPVLRVDPDAARANLAAVRGRTAGRILVAVVKDNAYGHGAAALAHALAREGVRRFAAGTVEEACALQDAGVPGEIMNLRLFRTGEAREIRERGIVQTVFAAGHLRALAEGAGDAAGRPARVQIKIDTGMGRFGAPPERFDALVRQAADAGCFRIEGVFSTLAEDPAFDPEQIGRFLDLRRQNAGRLRAAGHEAIWHLCSSDGILRWPDVEADAVRTGALLCGFPPAHGPQGPSPPFPLRPVARLSVPFLDIRDLPAGARFGYAGLPPLSSPARLGFAGIGQIHGLPAELGGRADALVGGRRCRILAVGGEYTVIRLDPSLPEPGRLAATLLGTEGDQEISLADWQRRAALSPYRALTGLRGCRRE